jgi:hypothetical protein
MSGPLRLLFEPSETPSLVETESASETLFPSATPEDVPNEVFRLIVLVEP